MAKYIIANWKENGNSALASSWIDTIAENTLSIKQNVTIIVCPPYPLLPLMTNAIKNTTVAIDLGAQNISQYEEGAYTGEVSAKMIKEFAQYVLIGHSERRQHFNETDSLIVEKTKIAMKYQLIPIVAISNPQQAHILKQYVPDFSGILLYEPVFAVGTGNAESPENANAVANQLKQLFPNNHVLYGGSVTGENAAAFFSQTHLEGIIVGQKSTDPSFFLDILNHAV